MRRRTLIGGLAGTVGAMGFMLGLGAWRSRPVADPKLPLPLSQMDWTLTDHLGATVQPQDWLNLPVMVFFGFTWCPDVCPTTLVDIESWLVELGPEADRLIVALITVDPERDTPEVLADYIGYFDPRMLALTGPAPEIAKAAEAFRVRYEKIPQDEGDYTMNHTAGVFLFRRGGSFAGIIDFHEDRRFAVPKIRRAME
ncbi:SCO family protein [Cereibacter sp. SYSU M97828]|nr:SCO family protein [Cereibacter flavus]